MDISVEADRISQAIPRLADGVEIIPNQGGTINLRGPVLRRAALNRWFAWLFRLPKQVEVELDDIGTFVVEQFGERTMDEIAASLGARYKLTRREAQAALTVFIKSLLQRRLLSFEGWYGLGNEAA